MSKKFCTNCGAELSENIRFCTSCGASVAADEVINPSPAPAPAVQPVPVAAPIPAPAAQTPPPPTYVPPQPAIQPSYNGKQEYTPGADSKYEPITTGGYIGIMLLMCIPFIGLILIIVWACGGCRKINKRNLARASLILMLISVVLSLIIGFALRKTVKKVTNSILPSSSITGELNGEDGSGSALDALSLLTLVGANANDSSVTNPDNSDKMNQLMEKALEKSEEYEEKDIDAAKANSKWPKMLPEYPDREFAQIEDYRVEIYDTTAEEMQSYIDTLKKEGYQYEDFLDFGFSEQDMLNMNGWWATNGTWYIGISYTEGTVILDYMDEKPTLDNLLDMMQ